LIRFLFRHFIILGASKLKKILTTYLSFTKTSDIIIRNDGDQVCNYLLHYLHYFSKKRFYVGFTSNNIMATWPSLFFLISMDTKKNMYLQIIGISPMFLNVATFRVTNRSISSTKKKLDFFKNIFI
jgi:hypothetical protein